jgi:hypothetical protein
VSASLAAVDMHVSKPLGSAHCDETNCSCATTDAAEVSSKRPRRGREEVAFIVTNAGDTDTVDDDTDAVV